MGIGKRIKETRKQLGMTQDQLAEKVGVKKATISNYENDASHPGEEILIKLMDSLGVDANYLFQDDYIVKSEPTLDQSIRMLCRNGDKISTQDAMLLMDIALKVIKNGRQD